MIKQILSLLAALWVLKRMDCPPSCSAGPVELTLLKEAICLGNLYIQEVASNSSASEGWMSVNVWDSWIKVQELVRPNAGAGWTVINRSIPCILSQFITASEGFRDNSKGSARFLDCFALVCTMAEDATPASRSAASIEEAQGVTQCLMALLLGLRALINGSWDLQAKNYWHFSDQRRKRRRDFISMSLHSIPLVDNGRLHHLDAWLHRLEFKPSDVHQPAVSWQRCGFGRSNHRNASERTMCLLPSIVDGTSKGVCIWVKAWWK